jgi:hypothetical protein
MIKSKEIGEHAGTIWRMLESKGETPVSQISKAAEMTAEECWLALGWLAREGKIEFTEIDGQKAVRLPKFFM